MNGALRRIAVLAVTAGVAAGLMRLSAGPTPSGALAADHFPLNLQRVLAERGLGVDPASVRWWPTGSGGLGTPHRAWFAATFEGAAADLWAVDARVAPTGVPLWVGRPTRITATPDGADRLLAAGPEGQIWAAGADAAEFVMWREGTRLRVYRLGSPSEKMAAGFGEAGAWLEVAGERAVLGAATLPRWLIRVAPDPPGYAEPRPEGAQARATPIGAWPPQGSWVPRLVDAVGAPLIVSGADGGVALLALATRRLAFEYVAGAAERGTDGAWGRGRTEVSRSEVVAVLDASAPTIGAVDEGRSLTPPRLGAATLAMDGVGRLAVGVWDVDGAAPNWAGVFQRARPLVVDGRTLPDAGAGWVSGVGVTADGIAVWARGEEAAVADALVRIGVVSAVVVATGQAATVALFPGGLDRPGEAVAGLGRPPVGAWRGVAAGGALVVRTRPDDFTAPGWRTVPRADGPAIAAVRRVRGVELIRLDARFLTPAMEDERARVRVGSGDQGIPGADGRVEGGVRLRPLRLGTMTLWSETDQPPELGRWRPGPEVEWAVQGLTLVDDGVVAPGARGRRPGRAVGVGRDAAERWVIGIDPAGDRAGLAAAMAEVGVQQALLVGHDTGRFTGQVRLDTGRAVLDRGLRPADPLPITVPQLVFWAHPGGRRAAAVRTFGARRCEGAGVPLCE